MVSNTTLEKVLKALSRHMFTDVEGESYNNNDIMEAQELLEQELIKQES